MCSAHSKILIAFTCSASSLCLSALVRYQMCIGKVVELSGQHLGTVWPMPEVYHNQVYNTGTTSEQVRIWYSTQEQTSIMPTSTTTTLHISSGVLATHKNATTLSIDSHIGKWLPTVQLYKCMTNWRQNASDPGRKYHSVTATLVFNFVATFLVKQHYHIVWTC